MTSIIIATKDRRPYLENLINSIRQYTDDYEIIVVDDVSKDDTNEWCDNQDLEYITYNNSIPVGQAWNMGCMRAKGKYIQILNDDMEVTPNWLSNQIELYEKTPNAGVFAAHLLRGEEVLSRGGMFSGTTLIPVPPLDEVQKVDYSNTPFMSKEVWQKVGGLPHYGQMYYEDAGLGLRCLKAGFVNLYNPFCVIKHATLGFKPEDGQLEYDRRQYNENVVQQESRVNFLKEWEEWLENRS